jgi:hypothetical protein
VNLRDIIEEVNNLLDYNPDLQPYKDAVSRTVSRHYQEISTVKPWLFMQNVATFPVYATVTPTATQTVTITPPTFTVTFAGITPLQSWVGAVFTGPDGNSYRIIRVFGSDAFIGPAYAGPAVAASNSWQVSFDRYALPPDCSEPLGFMDRENERGRLLFIDRRREEELFLNADDGGDVFVMIEDLHISDRTAEYPMGAALAAGGTLPVGTEFEYCYTFTLEGRESPPSIPTTAPKITLGNQTVDLSSLESTLSGGLQTGVLKNLYRRNKTGNGRWLRLQTGLLESVTTYSDDGSVSPPTGESAVLAPQEPRQYVRAYYTAEDDAKLELRYLRKPRRLQADSDVPLWPEQYHVLLVYRTLQDICMQSGMTGQATMYERRANDVMRRMEGKWLARSDKNLIRQGFTYGGVGYFERWGNPRKTG